MRHLDHEAAEAQVGSVGDVESGVVGVLAFVLQPHVHHHPLPVALDDAQRARRPAAAAAAMLAAESAARLHGLSAELTARQKQSMWASLSLSL